MNNMKRLLIYILLIASFLVLYYALAQSRMNVGMIGGLVVAASTTTTTAAGTYYYSDSGTGTGRGADNAALAANITCGQAGNITKLGVKIKSNPSSACSHIEFALYDGITPFSQLSAGGDTASVNEDSGCGSGGWNDYTLSSSVAVTLNQVVRVAMKGCTSGCLNVISTYAKYLVQMVDIRGMVTYHAVHSPLPLLITGEIQLELLSYLGCI